MNEDTKNIASNCKCCKHWEEVNIPYPALWQPLSLEKSEEFDNLRLKTGIGKCHNKDNKLSCPLPVIMILGNDCCKNFEQNPNATNYLKD